jgi:hypothetical protein
VKLPPARTLSRIASVPIALGSGSVLALAAWLEPSPLGHSTHTQLGMGQCTVLQLTGYPCPMCGMTTSFTLFMHLRPVEAILNQPFGLVMFLGTALMFGTAAAEVIAPRDRWSRLGRWVAPYEGHLATLFLVGMFLGWLYKSAMMVWL